MQVDLRELRKAARMSQVALAVKSGTDRTRICLAENGYCRLTYEEHDAIRKAVAAEFRERLADQQQRLQSFGIAV
jgi:transcriptional regulator with XRE-family HTH domain